MTTFQTPSVVAPNWESLMRLVLTRAPQTDPRYRVFQTACTQGRSQEVLRRYGIVSERDVDREFPKGSGA